MKTGKTKNRIREGNPAVTVLLYVLVLLICIATVYPMYYVLILSISAPEYAAKMNVYLVPKGFSLDAYKMLAGDGEMWRAYLNTILYTVPTTALMLVTSVLIAYPLTYKHLAGRKFVNMFLLIPMYFSGGMIPAFLLITKLKLYGSPLSQVLPVCFSIWNIILMKAFFSSIPEGLREAAKIDGAGHTKIFFQITFPLGKPILVTMGLFSALAYWNDWTNGLYYLSGNQGQKLYSIQNLLNQMITDIQYLASGKVAGNIGAEVAKLPTTSIRMAIAFIAMLPLFIIYPFLQKYFAEGITLGAVKG